MGGEGAEASKNTTADPRYKVLIGMDEPEAEPGAEPGAEPEIETWS